MELFRDEYLRRLGPNWGKITFDRIREREEVEKHESKKMIKLSNPVLKAMKNLHAMKHESNDDVWNCSELIQQMSEDDLCTFFNQPSILCSHLILQDWSSISSKVLRCISIQYADSLRVLDLSNSATDSSHLEIILPRTIKLQTLILTNCRQFDVRGFNILTKLSNSTLTELYVNRCPCVKEEPLMWIGGSVGFNQPKLKKLVLLDVSETMVTDNGLIAVAHGCKKLQYLNLTDCFQITDKAIQEIASHCHKLKLLNLSNCNQLTNKSLIAVSKYCHELVSISLTRLTHITDKGLIALASGCRYLQAMNIACCVEITEKSLCVLVENCKGILMLNVSGCPEVTVNGINAIIRGLRYVETATSFLGFKPIDKHIEKKLNDQMKMIRRQEVEQQRYLEHSQQEAEIQAQADCKALEEKSALIIQRQIAMYSCRMRYYKMWQCRERNRQATAIQRIFRGMQGRQEYHYHRQKLHAFLRLAPYATNIQRIVRGFLCRKHRFDITKVLCDFYQRRKVEAHSGIVVRFQNKARRHLAKLKRQAWRELHHHRYLDEVQAACTIQLVARGYIARMNMLRVRRVVERYQRVRHSASNYIQRWYRQQQERIRLKEEGRKLFERLRQMYRSVLLIQRVYRGYLGRQSYYNHRIDIAVMHRAAIIIQSAYRSSKILHWKDIKLNMIAAFVLDRHAIDRKNTVYRTRLRYQQFVYDNCGDSGSEPDEDQAAIAWIKGYDERRKRDYWYNNVNSDILFDEPRLNYAHEKALIGFRVKIYWIVQKTWYEGQITRFQPKTHRHRIQYDDGDREWINLEKEHERVQIQSEDGSWMLYQLYESSALKNEMRKIQATRSNEEFKQQAFADALQWKLIQSDNLHRQDTEVLFISQVTGEIRKGREDALDWIVQDDGFGYPCFYNTMNQQVEHEDPRFIHDEDDDLASQRRYVLQELRYVLYFCVEYWEQYSQALNNEDIKQQHILCLQVCKSLKPKHLSSFLIRAQALYKQTSVVDKPIHQEIEKELLYAAFISARMTDMSQRGEEIKRSRMEDKKQYLLSLEARSSE
jgi:hypothetical protein